MVTLLKKAINYYRYNGFLNTIKAGFRKAFPFIKKINKNKMRKFKNYKFDKKTMASKTELSNVVYKDNKKVYIFGTVPYYDVGGGQRSSQFSKIFNKLGFNVKYVYGFDSSESKIHFIELPLTLHMLVDNFKIEDFKNDLDENTLVIFEAPIAKFAPFLECASNKKAKIVYENIDNWEALLNTMVFDKPTLKLMLEKADMVVATAKLLVEQTKDYLKEFEIKKEVIYLANAVDDDLFEPRKKYELPKDFKIGRKTLIYYGSLWGEWFDFDIISEIAIKNPDITINLIGDFKMIKNKIKELPKNIYFLGLKKQSELPMYLAYSDFAIIPFKASKVGNFVSPLKIFEYIAMNKYVLATTLSDITNYPNALFSNDAKEWDKVINNEITIDIKARDNFIKENNWYERCTKILDYTFKNEKVDSLFYNNISVVILNYNNKNVIFKCIDTLLLNNKRYNYEIIVVDNTSTDGSYEELIKKYSDKIIIVKNEKNGCSSGRNLGVKNSTKDYILFLDSDEWILNNYFLDTYIDILKKDNTVGVVGYGAGWFNSNGYSYKTVDGYPYRYMKPEMLYRKDIGYLATCGFLMKKELFVKVDGFDIYYDPTGYEDTDLSLKIRNESFETVYSPYLGVGHLPHQTTKSGTDDHTKLLQEKGTYFINKWNNINKDLIVKYVK